MLAFYAHKNNENVNMPSWMVNILHTSPSFIIRWCLVRRSVVQKLYCAEALIQSNEAGESDVPPVPMSR